MTRFGTADWDLKVASTLEILGIHRKKSFVVEFAPPEQVGLFTARQRRMHKAKERGTATNQQQEKHVKSMQEIGM